MAKPENNYPEEEVELVEEEELGKEETEAEKLAVLEEQHLRLQAEFANYRKRTLNEKEQIFTYAAAELVEKLLPVLDNLERALVSPVSQEGEAYNVFVGFQMIAQQFLEILAQEGLQAITAVGTEFDPYFHEAVLQVPAEADVPDQQVVEEIRKGYCFKDKVLRVSQVKVAKQA